MSRVFRSAALPALVATLATLAAADLLAVDRLRADVDDLGVIGQRVEAGETLAAREAYLDLLSRSPSAAVHYNLGRVDQALEAGPQAVVWYRRALALAPDDPWARDNLEALRSDLGLPQPEAGLPLASLRAAAASSGWVATVLVLVLLASRISIGRPRGWTLLATAATILGGHAAVQTGARVAPKDAVLMASCDDDAGHLPAGSEVWVSRTRPAHVWSAGVRFECDPQSTIPVDSDRLPPLPTTQGEAPSSAPAKRHGGPGNEPSSPPEKPLT